MSDAEAMLLGRILAALIMLVPLAFLVRFLANVRSHRREMRRMEEDASCLGCLNRWPVNHEGYYREPWHGLFVKCLKVTP
jgi:hypothetical protein